MSPRTVMRRWCSCDSSFRQMRLAVPSQRETIKRAPNRLQWPGHHGVESRQPAVAEGPCAGVLAEASGRKPPPPRRRASRLTHTLTPHILASMSTRFWGGYGASSRVRRPLSSACCWLVLFALGLGVCPALVHAAEAPTDGVVIGTPQHGHQGHGQGMCDDPDCCAAVLQTKSKTARMTALVPNPTVVACATDPRTMSARAGRCKALPSPPLGSALPMTL